MLCDMVMSYNKLLYICLVLCVSIWFRFVLAVVWSVTAQYILLELVWYATNDKIGSGHGYCYARPRQAV